MSFHTRWANPGDYKDLAEFIDMTEDEYLEGIRGKSTIGLVIEPFSGEEPLPDYFTDEVIPVGFILYKLKSARLELLHISVHPDWRRKGAARAMLAKLTSKLEGHRRDYVRADVPESNYPAQCLLRACGWRASKVLRGGDEDSYRFIGFAPEVVAAQ